MEPSHTLAVKWQRNLIGYVYSDVATPLDIRRPPLPQHYTLLPIVVSAAAHFPHLADPQPHAGQLGRAIVGLQSGLRRARTFVFFLLDIDSFKYGVHGFFYMCRPFSDPGELVPLHSSRASVLHCSSVFMWPELGCGSPDSELITPPPSPPPD